MYIFVIHIAFGSTLCRCYRMKLNFVCLYHRHIHSHMKFVCAKISMNVSCKNWYSESIDLLTCVWKILFLFIRLKYPLLWNAYMISGYTMLIIKNSKIQKSQKFILCSNVFADILFIFSILHIPVFNVIPNITDVMLKVEKFEFRF